MGQDATAQRASHAFRGIRDCSETAHKLLQQPLRKPLNFISPRGAARCAGLSSPEVCVLAVGARRSTCTWPCRGRAR